MGPRVGLDPQTRNSRVGDTQRNPQSTQCKPVEYTSRWVRKNYTTQTWFLMEYRLMFFSQE